ncbi:PREDICTED: peroxidase 20 isoform X4 [Lupinus angustifolius]|uniref:peroxidase 20 isoform X3 n=1 Tax=Lupinus angustifolius TaxID=3871 RepID=UPI00092EDB90|nr:PREDICTED: peroxidase 20 isoform X3 [Lupinus angustifolius]XP_019421101.1 PREDICTED: peroxidase 20 isoform X4 [Lupinus angustifolius]
MDQHKRLLLILITILFNTSTLRGDELVQLVHDYYKEKCPLAEDIVRHNVEVALYKDPGLAASLLRLHFHDCFVMRGGPGWDVWLGRKDSLMSSFSGANQFIPAPNSSLEVLIDNFKQHGLEIEDMVALSGSHTIGRARCLSFRQRIYEPKQEYHYGYDRYKRYTTFRRILQSICPVSGRDNKFAPLDFETPKRFDNHYFINILEGKGLLGSDNVLTSQDFDGTITKQVWAYASNQKVFFASFAKSMIKMGNINVLTGNEGEIRRNCRFVNA